MYPQTIFVKTSKGVLEVKNKITRLPAKLLVVFFAVNGKSSVSILGQTLGMDESSLLQALHRLVADGYIKIFYEPREADQSSLVSADHDLDFTLDTRVVVTSFEESIVSIEQTQDVPTLTQAERGHAGADRVIRRAKSRMTGSSSCRHLIIASRIAPDNHLNEFGRKHLQHVFTDWFPQAIYGDLTAETVRLDVIVRNSSVDRNVYTTAFLKSDGSVIKTIDYAEGRLMNAKCPSYDQPRSGYCGTKDGADFRLVTYNATTR